MKNRDLELLSAYVDGQLSPPESARLEARLHADEELRSALADLRIARHLLHQLPQRKAPRNFTLTRKMVGLNPPLPRSYPFFRFATAFASLLLFFTFAINIAAPRLRYAGLVNLGSGGGYGGGPVAMQAAPEAAEAPLMEESLSAAADVEPSATTLPEEAAPLAKSAGTVDDAAQPNPTQTEAQPALISVGWQVAFLVIIFSGAALMFAMQAAAKRKWR